MTRFKAAYVSGPRPGPGHRAAARVRPVDPALRPRLCPAGRGPAPPPPPERREPVDSLLDVVVPARRARRACAPDLAAAAGRAAHPGPAAPPIGCYPRYGCTAVDEEWRGRLRAVTGIVDRPFDQRRDPLWADLSAAAGHAAVVGAPQSGKSTMLRTLICSLALLHTPAGGAVLLSRLRRRVAAGLTTLRTSAGWPAGWTPTRVRRTVAEVQSLLARRKRSSPTWASSRSPRTAGCRPSGEIAGRRLRRRVPGRGRLAHPAPGFRAARVSDLRPSRPGAWATACTCWPRPGMVGVPARDLGVGGVPLSERGAAELAAPDDQRVVQHPASLEVAHQRRRRTLRVLALLLELGEEVPVLVPAGVHQLHEPDAPFEQPAGDQAVVRERAVLQGVGTVASVVFDSFEKSTRSGTLVCIRKAISYWAMRVSISGSP